MKNIFNRKVETVRGFTLIELLIVIAILAILAAIVMVAINPAKQFMQARNVQREANVASILNAIGQNMVDNKGVLTGTGCEDIDTTKDDVGNDGYDLETCLDPYLPSGLPVDPLDGDVDETRYTVQEIANGNYEVCALDHEGATTDESDDAEYCNAR